MIQDLVQGDTKEKLRIIHATNLLCSPKPSVQFLHGHTDNDGASVGTEVGILGGEETIQEGVHLFRT